MKIAVTTMGVLVALVFGYLGGSKLVEIDKANARQRGDEAAQALEVELMRGPAGEQLVQDARRAIERLEEIHKVTVREARRLGASEEQLIQMRKNHAEAIEKIKGGPYLRRVLAARKEDL